MDMQPGRFFQLLSDETRLRSLLLMAHEGELCVCELMHVLDTIQPKISRHLAALRHAGLVMDRRQGQWIFYRIHPELPQWARRILEIIASEQPFTKDRAALTAMPGRPRAECCA